MEEELKEEKVVETKENVNESTEQEKLDEKLKNKKSTFTLIYILIGLFIIAVLGMLLYAFIVTRQFNKLVNFNYPFYYFCFIK